MEAVMKSIYLVTILFLTLFFSYANAFEVTSPVFSEGSAIPKIYACTNKGGKNISIPLSISGVPDGTKSLAIVMDDPDAKSVAGKTWVHWVLTDIPADKTSIPELKNGKHKFGKLGRNSSGGRSYQGMCPPSSHKYFIAVYALNNSIGKKIGDITRKMFEKKYKKIIIEKAEISGKYP